MHGWDALQVGDTREQTYSKVPVRCFGGPLFLLNNPWIDPTGYGRRLTSTTTHLSSSVDTLATCQWMYTQRDASAACVRERGTLLHQRVREDGDFSGSCSAIGMGRHEMIEGISFSTAFGGHVAGLLLEAEKAAAGPVPVLARCYWPLV